MILSCGVAEVCKLHHYLLLSVDGGGGTALLSIRLIIVFTQQISGLVFSGVQEVQLITDYSILDKRYCSLCFCGYVN